MLLKVIKHNGKHELFMNMYFVVGQRYYYIDAVECNVYAILKLLMLVGH